MVQPALIIARAAQSHPLVSKPNDALAHETATLVSCLHVGPEALINLLLLLVVQVVGALGENDLRGSFHHDQLVGLVTRAAGNSKAPLVCTVERNFKHLRQQQKLACHLKLYGQPCHYPADGGQNADRPRVVNSTVQSCGDCQSAQTLLLTTLYIPSCMPCA